MPEKTQKNQQQDAQPIQDQAEEKRQFTDPERLIEEEERRDRERTAADG
ncbi:MAG: hypothetical protein WD058_08870 [Dehalococcoidia bacterium]